MKGITKWLVLSIVIHLVLFKLLSVVYVNKAPKEVKEQKANRTVIEASLILTPVKATPIKAKTGNSLRINDKTTAAAEDKQTSDVKMAKQAHLTTSKTKPQPPKSQVTQTPSKKSNKPNVTDNLTATKEPILEQQVLSAEVMSMQSIKRATTSYLRSQDQKLSQALISQPKKRFVNQPVPSKRLAKRFSPDPMADKYKGRPVVPIATLADGSEVVKLQGVCHNVSENEWREQLWTPTKCPEDADKTAQRLKQILRKYGLSK